MTSMTVPSTAHIHEALTELKELRVIIDHDEVFATLDLYRLSFMGYCLKFEFDGVPKFILLNEEFDYMYNPIMYTGNKIPIKSLESYTLAKLRESFSSIN